MSVLLGQCERGGAFAVFEARIRALGHQHPDHIAVGRLCNDALRLARYGGIAELRALPPHAVSHAFAYAVTPSGEPSRQCAAIHPV